MAWDNNAERKEHTRESAEVTISLDKEELEKIAAFAELDVDTMSVEDLAEALHGIVAEMEAPEQEQTVSKEEVIAWGKETLSDLTNGTNQLVITPSGYDDFISSSTILNAFQEYSGSKPKVIRPENTSFSDYLYDEVQDSLFDNVMYLEENLASQIKTLAEEKGDAFVEALENLDEDLPYELLEQFGYEGASVDMSEFLDHDYKVNLLLATKQELNYDNTSISRMAHGIIGEDGKLTLKDYNDFHDKTVTAADQLETYSDNALSYLVHQQGYTVEEMMHTVQARIAESNYDTSEFIESVVNELDGTYSDYNEQLTALISINGNNLVEMLDKVAEGKDNIVLGTDTVIGLYDRMNGAGSDFEIQLEEDMVIPTAMVQIVQMESSGRSDVVSSKDNIGYSVDDTYGFVGTQWQDSYKGITDKAPTLVQENMKETYEKLNNFEPEKDDVIKDDKEDDFGLD